MWRNAASRHRLWDKTDNVAHDTKRTKRLRIPVATQVLYSMLGKKDIKQIVQDRSAYAKLMHDHTWSRG